MTAEDTLHTVTLTGVQLRDVKIFLERCDLKGVEVARFLSLAQAIGQAKVVEPPSPEIEIQKVD